MHILGKHNLGTGASQAWLGSALPVADAAHRAATQAANSFSACRALVLDSSYRPIDVVNWQRAICLDLFDKVDVLGARPACVPPISLLCFSTTTLTCSNFV